MKITGKTLIEHGFKPNPWFKDAINFLNSLDFVSTDYLINYCNKLELESKPKYLEPFSTPVDYNIFLEANSVEEKENLDLVIQHMNKIMVTPTIVGGAIMPDACPVGGNNIPVGGVAITKNTIHPSMHSSDVCCSVATSELHADVDMKRVLDEAMKVTHFGAGGRKRMQYGFEDDYLYDAILDNYFTKDYIEKACSHLVTQGDGNHFLFVGRSDKTDKVHIVTHHGSRGFGASVYKKALNEAKNYCKNICSNTTNPWLDYNTDIGKEYWDALQIVKQWTFRNHNIIHNRILDKVGVGRSDFYWNEHNFVFKDGDNFYHAKGSTPMDSKFNVGDTTNPSNNRLIPLSMNQPILVVKNDKRNTFGFAPHGAGRNLSRTAFEKKYSNVDLMKEISHLDIRFFSNIPDLSELPQAYKSADEVIRQIEKFNLAKIVDKIQPYGCIMAGKQDIIWKKK